MNSHNSKLRRLALILSSPIGWLFAALALVSLTAAFQIPYTYRIDLGGTQGRFFIRQGVFDSQNEPERNFRWTQDRAVLAIPALTQGAWTLALELNGWQPEGPPRVRLKAGDTDSTRATNGDWQRRRETFNAAAGDLNVVLETPVFHAPDYGSPDPRTLGVRIASLVVQPNEFALRVPPWEYVLGLTLANWLFFVIVALLARIRYALVASALLLAQSVVGIIGAREFLNLMFVQTLLVVLVVGFLFVLFGLDALQKLYARVGLETSESVMRWLGFVVWMTWGLKVIGSFYPHIQIFDALFHTHRLEFIEQAILFFVVRSREFQGLETVYPPALYVFLAPLAALVQDNIIVLKIAAPTFEVVSALMLFALARKIGLNQIAAVCALALYLCTPLAFIIFGWGIYANIFAGMLLILLLLLWFMLPWRTRPYSSLTIFTFVMFLELLAHASMLPLMLAFWSLFGILVYFKRPRAWRQLAPLGAAVALAMLLAFGLYFSFFIDKTIANLSVLNERTAVQSEGFKKTVGNGISDTGLGLVPVRVTNVNAWLTESAWYLAREGWVYYRGLPVLLALLGIVWMWQRPALNDAAIVLSAGLITVLLFFVVGVLSNLYTRYMLFGAPFFALGAGFVLGELWMRGRWMQWAVIGILGLTMLSGIAFWIARVVT